MDAGTAAPTLETHADTEASPSRRGLAILCLTAMGIVYGDIGTSPLYALRECFFGPHAVPVTRDNVLGALARYGLEVDPARTTFFLSRSTVLSRRKGIAAYILDRIFIFMARNAQVPTQFFRLPPNRVIEIGMRVEI